MGSTTKPFHGAVPAIQMGRSVAVGVVTGKAVGVCRGMEDVPADIGEGARVPCCMGSLYGQDSRL